MKKIFSIIIIIFITHFNSAPAYAVITPTPESDNSSVGKKMEEQINQLKEKIASRVSELNLVEKRGIIGIVAEVKGNQLTFTDLSGNTRFADVDEITKFSSTGSSGFGLSDLSKGSKITILGIYNKQSKRVLARFIKTYSIPTIYTGSISSLDAKNFQLIISTADQKQIKVDVDTATKVSSYTSGAGLARYGFSKLAIGDRVAVAGAPAKTDANLFSANRLVDFIGLPKDPQIQTGAAFEATPTESSPVPTARGAKNLNPLR